MSPGMDRDLYTMRTAIAAPWFDVIVQITKRKVRTMSRKASRRWIKGAVLCLGLAQNAAYSAPSQADDSDKDKLAWIIKIPNYYFTEGGDTAIPVCGLVSGSWRQATIHYVFDCKVGRELADRIQKSVPASAQRTGGLPIGAPAAGAAGKHHGGRQSGIVIIPMEVGGGGHPGGFVPGVGMGVSGGGMGFEKGGGMGFEKGGGMGFKPGNGMGQPGVHPGSGMGGSGLGFTPGGTVSNGPGGFLGAGGGVVGGSRGEHVMAGGRGGGMDMDRQRAEAARTAAYDKPIQRDDFGNALVAALVLGPLGAVEGSFKGLPGAAVGIWGAIGSEAQNIDLGTPPPSEPPPGEYIGEADDPDWIAPAPTSPDDGEADDVDWVNGDKDKGGRPSDDSSGGGGVIGPRSHGYRPADDGTGVGGPAANTGHLFMPAPDDTDGSPIMHFERVGVVSGKLQFVGEKSRLFFPNPEDGGGSPIMRSDFKLDVSRNLETMIVPPAVLRNGLKLKP